MFLPLTVRLVMLCCHRYYLLLLIVCFLQCQCTRPWVTRGGRLYQACEALLKESFGFLFRVFGKHRAVCRCSYLPHCVGSCLVWQLQMLTDKNMDTGQHLSL